MDGYLTLLTEVLLVGPKALLCKSPNFSDAIDASSVRPVPDSSLFEPHSKFIFQSKIALLHPILTSRDA